MRQWTKVLIILLLLLSACSRRQEEERTVLRPPAVKEAGSPPERARTTSEQEEAPALPPLTPAKQEHVMLPLGRRNRALPEDFKIGLLEDRLAAYREQAELLATVSAFLDDLTRADILSDALLPESTRSLSRHLLFYLDRDIVPTGYRLGAITYFPPSRAAGEAPREARMGVRLFKQESGAPAQAASEGVFYLEKQDERWLIADLQIDFQALGTPYIREEQKFIPSSYRWMAGGS